MSISVVTVRDYEGVPATRELYARGIRYVINSGGDLEVLGDGRPGGPLGYYPSGNWMSVFVDDPVRILVKGEEDTSIIGGASATSVAGTATIDDATIDGTAIDGTAAIDDAVGLDDTSDDAAIEDVATDIDVEPVSVVDEPDTPIFHKVAEDLAAASAAVEPADDEPAPDADFGTDFHTDFAPDAPAVPPAEPAPTAAPKQRRSTIPAGMQPVKFGPRIIKPPKPKVVADPTRHMMPVTFRSRPLRAGLSKPAPAQRDDEPRADDSGGDEG